MLAPPSLECPFVPLQDASSGANPNPNPNLNPDPNPDLNPDQGRVARSWLSLDADAMRPSVELYVDEGKAEATGVCLGLESLTKRGEFSSAMARNCTVTALEDSFLMQFALEATNSVLVEGTSHPRPTPNLNPKPIPHLSPSPSPSPYPYP